MSKRPKNPKKQISEQKEVPTKEPKQTITFSNEVIKANDSPQKGQNLTTVREASQASQEGKSRNTNRTGKKTKQNQEQKKATIQEPIKQQPQKEQDIVYDQYNILKISGLLDAYQHFLKLLCKHGLPTGKVYEYAAQQIQKYEKHKINKELKMRAELDIQKRAKKGQVSQSPPRTISVSPYKPKPQN